MKAIPVKHGDRFFWCELCEEYINADNLNLETVYVHNEGDQISSSYLTGIYYTSDCRSEDIYYCEGCDEWLPGVPSEAYAEWQCWNCKQCYIEKDTADECCT